MKINLQILSIPPYISTAWKNIASLHVEHELGLFTLIVTLLNGARIEVPHLEPSMIEAAFAAHARFLEQEEKPVPSKIPPRTPLNFSVANEQVLAFELPFKGDLAEMESFGTLLQHNPQQADSPSLPAEILGKITQIAKSMGIDDANAVPKPEPHCNCVRCQIARAMQVGVGGAYADEQRDLEEIVSDEELTFKTWDVIQTDEKLYVVTNPLDAKEHYNVYLGEPIGCTCGAHQCVHVHAVLKT